ncbi:MAG: sensor histidine kinase [Betaproteobacteria bacterium]|nr:sensor histidine kinase [Betaproteobacteria bacterium]
MRRLLQSGFSAAVDTFLYRLSVYGVPIAIALASLAALSLWQQQYHLEGASLLELTALEQTGPDLTPAQALQQLADKSVVPYRNTRLSEAPFWISFVAPVSDQPVIAEFPSRHTLKIECWRADDFLPLGAADRSKAEGSMRAVKAGFALELGRLPSAIRVLCRASHTGPAHITVVLWPAEQFRQSELKFHRNSGLLDGGLITLSLFVLLAALISREWLYVLFAAWLVANLRLAALSAGWDTQWLERAIPPDWLIPMRKLTTSAYYVLTITLFSSLFFEDLKREKYALLARISQWSCLPLLLAAFTLPYAKFLPLLWVLTAYTVAVFAFLLIRILAATRSRVALWYGAGITVTLFAGLDEVVAAALGYRYLIGSVNSITAALSSSLLVALAIAEQMRQERLGRRRAEDELRILFAHQARNLEEERKRMAAAIHDELGQHLTALQMGLFAMRMNHGEKTVSIARVDGLLSSVELSMNFVRRMAANLRPAALNFGLLPAIEWLAGDFSQRHGIDCKVEVSGDPVDLQDDLATAVFRIVQESLTNVARHAHASAASITLNYSCGKLSLRIRDNGRGFDPVRDTDGFGLLSMRERILAAGGEIRIDTKLDSGTTISIEMIISGKADD